MIYLLDTNICVFHLNNSKQNMSTRLRQTPIDDIKLPSMVAAELLYGAEKSARREQNLKIVTAFLSIYEIVPFDETAAGYYARIRAKLESAGMLIGNNDITIAATALAHNGVIVTNNTGEFSRVDDLVVEDWTL
ncbi:MAG: type II toxin-antitoxin system VapC family toxin [Oscillospiraceae bacterium]|nr:type II toxin-antitoxin system VapC family toxin [Oscillospiraceae bacterium]